MAYFKNESFLRKLYDTNIDFNEDEKKRLIKRSEWLINCNKYFLLYLYRLFSSIHQSTDGIPTFHSIEAFSYFFRLVYNINRIKDMIEIEDSFHIETLYNILSDTLAGKFSAFKFIYFYRILIDEMNCLDLNTSIDMLCETNEDGKILLYGYISSIVNSKLDSTLRGSGDIENQMGMLVNLMDILNILHTCIKNNKSVKNAAEYFQLCFKFFGYFENLFYAYELYMKFFFTENFASSYCESLTKEKIINQNRDGAIVHIVDVVLSLQKEVENWRNFLCVIDSKLTNKTRELNFLSREMEPSYVLICSYKQIMSLVMSKESVIGTIMKFKSSIKNGIEAIQRPIVMKHVSEYLFRFKKQFIYTLWNEFHFRTWSDCNDSTKLNLSQLLNGIKIIAMKKCNKSHCIPREYLIDYLDQISKNYPHEYEVQEYSDPGIEIDSNQIFENYMMIYEDYMLFEFLIFTESIKYIISSFGHSITCKDSQNLIWATSQRLIKKYQTFHTSGLKSIASEPIESYINLFCRDQYSYKDFIKDLGKIIDSIDLTEGLSCNFSIIKSISKNNLQNDVNKLKVNNILIAAQASLNRRNLDNDRRIVSDEPRVSTDSLLVELCPNILKHEETADNSEIFRITNNKQSISWEEKNFCTIFEIFDKDNEEFIEEILNTPEDQNSGIYIQFKFFYLIHIILISKIFEKYVRQSEYSKTKRISILEWLMFQLKNIRVFISLDWFSHELCDNLYALIKEIKNIKHLDQYSLNAIFKRFQAFNDLTWQDRERELFIMQTDKMLQRFDSAFRKQNLCIDSIMEL